MADKIVALVGGETLLGADVRELIADRLPQVRTRLIGAQSADGLILTEVAGEAAVITALDGENLTSAQAVVLAGSPESSRKAMALMRGWLDPVVGHHDGPQRFLLLDEIRVLQGQLERVV